MSLDAVVPLNYLALTFVDSVCAYQTLFELEAVKSSVVIKGAFFP
jgi:hypothetical protein